MTVSIVLRAVKGTPLTNDEVDDNFTNLKDGVEEYTAADVLTKIKTVDGTGSGLDADLLDGLNSSSAATASTIVARDASGNFSAATITANLTGNVTGNLTGSVTGNISGSAGSVAYTGLTGTVPTWNQNTTGTAAGLSAVLAITSGGTGATTPTTARSNLSAATRGVNTDITSLTGLTTALSVPQGGTGTTALTANTVLIGAGTGAVSGIAPGTAGNVLTSSGTTWTSSAIPTLNQNTTGNAATSTILATGRLLNGRTFNGSANVNHPGLPYTDVGSGQVYSQPVESSDLNLCISAGDYNFSDSTANKPDGINSWGFLRVARHYNISSGNVYVHQTAYDMNGADAGSVYVRRGLPSAGYTATWSAWTQLATTDYAYGHLSNNTNGWTKLPNGLIMQWFQSSNRPDFGGIITVGINYPIAFPNAVHQVVVSGKQLVYPGPYATTIWYSASAANQLSVCTVLYNESGGVTQGTFQVTGWAIGY